MSSKLPGINTRLESLVTCRLESRRYVAPAFQTAGSDPFQGRSSNLCKPRTADFAVRCSCALAVLVAITLNAAGTRWPRHTIDNSSRGADGVRLADVNGDGLLDVVTGWEEGGTVRICRHPGSSNARGTWPAVTVGRAPDVEDAVFADLDGDGAPDVVSCTEGKTRTVFVHWAPHERARYFDANAWRTETLPASTNLMQWMFALPMQIDGRHGLDFFAGGKNDNAQLGWWEAPAQPRRLAEWKWHPLRRVGWLMSLVASDMDGDGDSDLVLSDRKGNRSGCFWLENPGTNANLVQPWREHVIGGLGREMMFLALTDLDRDGLQDVVAAAKPKVLLFLRRLSRDGQRWDTHTIALPANTGNAKAVNAGDIDGDGKTDLVFTCEGATGGRSGVMWLSFRASPRERDWQPHEISGSDGVKHDLVELLDLDGDGDLDVLTCEETKNLGVFWYENPR